MKRFLARGGTAAGLVVGTAVFTAVSYYLALRVIAGFLPRLVDGASHAEIVSWAIWLGVAEALFFVLWMLTEHRKEVAFFFRTGQQPTFEAEPRRWRRILSVATGVLTTLLACWLVLRGRLEPASLAAVLVLLLAWTHLVPKLFGLLFRRIMRPAGRAYMRWATKPEPQEQCRCPEGGEHYSWCVELSRS